MIKGKLVLNESKYIYALDAGHGSNTAGKRSPVWEDGSQLLEWEYTRDLRNRIINLMELHRISYYIVNPEDYDVSLSERAHRINEVNRKYGNVITISLHGNAAGVEQANGYEVFTSPGQTQSDKIADLFYRRANQTGLFKMRKDTRDGDNDKEERFTILTRTTTPSILTENGFYTNKRECKEMMTDNFKDKISLIHTAAILDVENLNF